MTPISFIVLYGLGYSLLVAALFPCVPLIIQNDDQLGTAFGIIFTLQNAGLVCL